MFRFPALILSSMLPLSAAKEVAADYDPLKVPEITIESKALEVNDSKRGRVLPLRVYPPVSSEPAPVILFSHGLGGSRDNNPYLGNHWAKRGYLVVFIQHPGSDEQVWKEQPALQRMSAMKNAASLDNFLARGADIPAVIDALTAWNRQSGHALAGRMNLEKIGMSGHSFGANTTQSVAGQSFPGGRSFLEPRIDAALMMSPGPPARGNPATAFAEIKIPCLLMTGTRDDSPIGSQSAEDRLKVFPNLKNAPAWQVVFDGADHMAFSESNLRRGALKKDPRYHRAILALGTAFWDTHLKGEKSAESWLNGPSAKSVLATNDDWRINENARIRKP
jgi:predicted dienelactone hydrolase